MICNPHRSWFLVPVLLLLAMSSQACAAGAEVAPAPIPIIAGPTQLLPEKTIVPTPTVNALPAIPEHRRVVLEWPPVIRAGDSDTVRLTLEMDQQGNITSTAEVAGHEISSQSVQVPNLYETHHILAEARLDLAGVEISPNDLVSQSLLPGQAVSFYWSISPSRVNTYRGTVWLFLRFIPIQGGLESRRALSAQRIEIQSVDLLGLTGTPARVVGGIGAVFGAALGLDNVIPWIWKLLSRKKGLVKD